MPIPILIAAAVEAAGLIFGEAAVEAAIASAAEWLGIEGGLTALTRSLQLFIMRWSGPAIEALEATLNPLPTYTAAVTGFTTATTAGAGAFSKSSALLLAEFSAKEQLLMKIAIRLARRAGHTMKGEHLKQFLLNDLLRAVELLGSRAAHHSQIPNGLSGMGILNWLPMGRGSWAIWRQVDVELIIQKIAGLGYTNQVVERAGEAALKAIKSIESSGGFARFAHSPGVKKFLRLLADGGMAVVYEAPGCGEVVIEISHTTVSPVINNGLILQSLRQTRSLWGG